MTRLLVHIDLPDLAPAERFYCADFDLKRVRRFGDHGVELLGEQASIYLLAKAAGSVAAPDASRDYHRHWTPLHLDFVVEHLDAARLRAVEEGAWAEGEVREYP